MIGPMLAAAGGLPEVPPPLPGEIGCYSSTRDEVVELAGLLNDRDALERDEVACAARRRELAAKFDALTSRVRDRVGIPGAAFQRGDVMHFDGKTSTWAWIRPSASTNEEARP